MAVMMQAFYWDAPSKENKLGDWWNFVAEKAVSYTHLDVYKRQTLYGAYDVGVGWVSHGLPENGYNYEGASLVNRNGYQHRFLIAPNNLQQTGLGIRGKEEFLPGWSVVFNALTGINPQSGLLANASATDLSLIHI